MPIVQKKGRARSFRTREELLKGLQGDLDALTPEEREVLPLLLDEIEDSELQGSRLIDAIGAAEYAREPVDIHTFVHDRYYLGNTCDTIYPILEEDCVRLFSGGYHEAIITGGIGIGKTFFASIGICRILYEISCMKNPHKSFGLATDSNISIVCLSVNEGLAIRVAFENIATKIKASPYFQENFPFNPTKKELRFPHSVWVAARATTDGSVLGLNTIAGLLDETNFMPRTAKEKAADSRYGRVDHADMLYAAIKRRMKSRFEKRGRLPGMLFIVSSKKTSDDFTARRINDAKTDPSVFVIDYALWDVKPDAYLGDEKFYVLVGNEQIPSRILTAEERREYDAELPDGCVLIDVPESYRPDFEADLEGAIRDIGGISTVSVSPFIQRREKILDAINPDREHPYSKEFYEPFNPGRFIRGIMVGSAAGRSGFLADVNRDRPLLNPTAPRHIHIDPSLTGDATGICMAHVGGFKDVIRRADDGREFLERAPMYYVDLLLRVVPPPGHEIVLGDIRHLIYELTDMGYMITTVSLDSWQSRDAIQQLQQRGYQAEVLSVDKTPTPYDTLKMALYEDRVDYYRYPILLEELRKLQEDRTGRVRKIDHPIGGSKDVADSLAGVIFTLSRRVSTQPLPVMRSSSYTVDPWMPEQAEAQMAGNPVGFEDMILPAFFFGDSSFERD